MVQTKNYIYTDSLVSSENAVRLVIHKIRIDEKWKENQKQWFLVCFGFGLYGTAAVAVVLEAGNQVLVGGHAPLEGLGRIGWGF